jgi:hypothetical protein
MVRLGRPRAWSPAEPRPPGQGWAGWPEPVESVHLLFLNRPPDDIPPDDGGATIVPAASCITLACPSPTASGCLTSSPAIRTGTRARWCSCRTCPPNSPARD